MGSRVGVLKIAAKKLGLEFGEYQARLAAGEKWCIGCDTWHPRVAFGADKSRSDGLAAACIKSRAATHPPGWKPAPKTNPLTGKPGPAPAIGRDGDKIQARSRINREVKNGSRPNPNAVLCTDCGHLGRDRRHEYDHHRGYAAEHHGDVQVVCTRCHHKREMKRG